MSRVCFTLRVRSECLPEYRARHRDVWPEMREALRRTGWRNYSLFEGPGGSIIGYLETDDFTAATRAMEAEPVNARWQAEMAPLFVEGSGLELLPEVFHLA